jgi:hypothetical protein
LGVYLRLFRDDTRQSEELPVVVVLAHKENMTGQSSYLMVLLLNVLQLSDKMIKWDVLLLN